MPKFTLRRVRLSQGGYDPDGRYWGTGQPLYYYTADYPDTWNAHHTSDCPMHNPIPIADLHINSDTNVASARRCCAWCGRPAWTTYNNDVSDYLRADNRADAMDAVRAKYPDATF